MRYYFIDILDQQQEHIASFASCFKNIKQLKVEALKLVPGAASINIDDGNNKINFVLT